MARLASACRTGAPARRRHVSVLCMVSMLFFGNYCGTLMPWSGPVNRMVSAVSLTRLGGGASTHKLFVYGTLKRGFTNYKRYLGVAEEHGKAKFLGYAHTKDSFPLVVRPAHVHSATRAPVLMDKAGAGHQIEGEMYEVDSSTLEAMDILEGVRSAKYYNKEISVIGEGDKQEHLVQTYFFPASDELLKEKQFPTYNAKHHSLYNPAPVKDEILQLCQHA